MGCASGPLKSTSDRKVRFASLDAGGGASEGDGGALSSESEELNLWMERELQNANKKSRSEMNPHDRAVAEKERKRRRHDHEKTAPAVASPAHDHAHAHHENSGKNSIPLEKIRHEGRNFHSVGRLPDNSQNSLASKKRRDSLLRKIEQSFQQGAGKRSKTSGRKRSAGGPDAGSVADLQRQRFAKLLYYEYQFLTQRVFARNST